MVPQEHGTEAETEKEKCLQEILDYYGNLPERASQESVVAMLREIQELCGFLSPEVRQAAADAAGVKLSVITCIMGLYKSLKPAPYRHQVTVCCGPRCVKADGSLLEAVKDELGIRGVVGPGGSLSADKSILLTTKNCMKHCKTSPNLSIDGVHYPHVGGEEGRKLLRAVTGHPPAKERQ